MALAGQVSGLETDQFSAWGRPLEDATAAINAKYNLEIARALEDLQASGRPHASCNKVVRAVKSRLKGELFQPIELWAVQSPLVDQAPPPGAAAHAYTAHSVYRRHGPLDLGTWMPLSPTIEVGGFRFGTDKLAHMVASGWRYRNRYLRHVKAGKSKQEAIDAAIRWGILEERSIMGNLGDGVFSHSDLEADYEGMLFYLSLCQGPDPILVDDGSGWRFRRPFDMRDYVGPEWDESYEISTYRRGRWRKVKPEVEALCPRLDEPSVRQRFERYRAVDTVTPTERLVDELVAEGKLEVAHPFTLEKVCPQAASLPPPSGTSNSPSARRKLLPSPELTARLETNERNRVRRLFVPWSVGYFYPRSYSAAVGLLDTSVPRTSDCRSLCDLRGPTAQLALGWTGAQLSAGWGRVFAETGPRRRLITDAYMAYGVRVAILRTWGDSPLTPNAQTLVGLEGAFSIAHVSFTLGALHRVAGADGEAHWIVSGGLGYGF